MNFTKDPNSFLLGGIFVKYLFSRVRQLTVWSISLKFLLKVNRNTETIFGATKSTKSINCFRIIGDDERFQTGNTWKVVKKFRIKSRFFNDVAREFMFSIFLFVSYKLLNKRVEWRLVISWRRAKVRLWKIIFTPRYRNYMAKL